MKIAVSCDITGKVDAAEWACHLYVTVGIGIHVINETAAEAFEKLYTCAFGCNVQFNIVFSW